MILELPSIESFIAEAKDGGAVRAYVVRKVEYRRANGLPTWRVRLVVTALGELACRAGRPEKALLRYEKDFGPVLETPAAGRMPEDYHQKVERSGEEIRARLAQAGFEVRDGEIASA